MGPRRGVFSMASRLADRIDILVDLVGRLVAWLTLALVALVALNVLARYLLSAGTVALQELEWHLLAVTALIGMSYGINRGEEVRVDMLYARYGPRTKAIVDAAAGLMTVAVALLIMKVSFAYVAQSYAYQEGSPDPGGLPFRYLLKSLIPLGFALLALQGFVEFVKALRRWPPAGPAALQGTSHTTTMMGDGNGQ